MAEAKKEAKRGVKSPLKKDTTMTSLIGGKRVKKSSGQIELLGTLDELSASIELCMNYSSKPLAKELCVIVNDLGAMMSDAAVATASSVKSAYFRKESVDKLLESIEKEKVKIPYPHRFTKTGKGVLSAHLNKSRTIARRAERRMVDVTGKSNANVNALEYLNLLSTYLYILSIRHIEK